MFPMTTRPMILMGSVVAAVALLPTNSVAGSHATSVVKTRHTKATPNVNGGGLFTIRATRQSPRQVRVTLKLVVRAKRPTRGSFMAGPCTKGGCIDTGSRRTRNFPLERRRTTIVRTLTLRRTHQGAIACVTAWGYDLGPDGSLIRGTIGELKLCPR